MWRITEASWLRSLPTSWRGCRCSVPAVRTGAIDPAEHDRFSRSASSSEERDSQLSLDVLEARFGLHRNYDALVADLDALRALERALVRPGLSHRRRPRGAARLLASHGELLERKSVVRRALQSQNAKLTNSFATYRILATDLADRAARDASASRLRAHAPGSASAIC